MKFLLPRIIKDPVGRNSPVGADLDTCSGYTHHAPDIIFVYQAFDLQTVNTNMAWIDQYFLERIQRTEPVAFNKVSSDKIKAKDQPKFFEQRSIQVSYLNQYGHLATFIFKTAHQPKRAAQPQSHTE